MPATRSAAKTKTAPTGVCKGKAKAKKAKKAASRIVSEAESGSESETPVSKMATVEAIEKSIAQQPLESGPGLKKSAALEKRAAPLWRRDRRL